MQDILSAFQPSFASGNREIADLERRVSIFSVQQAVCLHFLISPLDQRSQRRLAPICLARHAAMWLCRMVTEASYPEIGRKFGNRDHTSVMHAVARIHRLMEVDPSFAVEMQALRLALATGTAQ